MSSIPEGGSLNQGTMNQDGSYQLSLCQAEGVILTLWMTAFATFDLPVSATSHDDHQTTTSAAQQIHVAVAPEAPVLTVADASGNEEIGRASCRERVETVEGGETIN